MMKFLKVYAAVVLISMFSSCREEEITKEPESIPKEEKQPQVEIEQPPSPTDKGGIQNAHFLKPEVNVYGHYLYLPNSYKNAGPEYPLIVFLHGMGERGNSKNNPADLEKVLLNGVPTLIKRNLWNPKYQAIIASPQCHDEGWNAQKLHKFIAYLVKHYSVDKSMIYLTGLSMGGFGTFEYLQAYGDSSYVAAAVPICGGGRVNKATSFLNTPVWAFHGQDDKTINPLSSINMISAINKLAPTFKAKLTIFPKWAMHRGV